jgi:hypothetical protein
LELLNIPKKTKQTQTLISLRLFDLLSVESQQDILNKMNKVKPINMKYFSKLVESSTNKLLSKTNELIK